MVDLLPYVHPDEDGTTMISASIILPSDVTYDEAFVNAMIHNDLDADAIYQSPYLPLWLEDHLLATYNQEIKFMQSTLPVQYINSAYTINNIDIEEGTEKSLLTHTTSNRRIPTYTFMLIFCVLLILEEEVRRRV